MGNWNESRITGFLGILLRSGKPHRHTTTRSQTGSQNTTHDATFYHPHSHLNHFQLGLYYDSCGRTRNGRVKRRKRTKNRTRATLNQHFLPTSSQIKPPQNDKRTTPRLDRKNATLLSETPSGFVSSLDNARSQRNESLEEVGVR